MTELRSLDTSERSAPEVRTLRWRFAEILLLVVWVLAALVAMYPRIGRALHLHGGFFTNYGADITFPPWFYIQLRARSWRMIPAIRFFGRSAELSAMSIFVVGLATELSQYYW